MKTTEMKHEFIRMRAENRSYDEIRKELEISKSTCSAWETELSEGIAKVKAGQLQALYDEYFMTREARIKTIGESLKKVNEALEGADLSEVAPDKLLDQQLKLTEALKKEYISPSAEAFNGDITPLGITEALADLLGRIKQGEVTAEQAGKESIVLTNLLKAYETGELKQRIDLLDALVTNKSLEGEYLRKRRENVGVRR